MFSKSCEYALRSILYITLHTKNDQAVGLKQISASQDIPLHFLSKILQQLVKHKMLNSVKGPNGGFSLNMPPNELRLIKVVELIDGLDILDRCGIGLKQCSDKTPCPIHFDYKIVKEKIRHLLNEKTLLELCQDVEEGKSIVSYK
ncbi:Rrf2 family transcriptional regulator [Fulvivirgaceae bacterium BMA12]|uniref:Rrf2 family transcriptional regulator n=1 Tax=Agaribacillus aureus TaxID=3051825 RepID=A0ABT8LIQ6_9BACT|nr:Rrf2 family transcriptional regulator [Fulvivirgaceae bacterium BMA12]